MKASYPFDGFTQSRLWGRLAVPWVTFWMLMLVVGIEEYLWSGGRHVWEPLVNYGAAALATSVLAVMQTRRARQLDGLLGQPVRWFIRMWAWMPLQLVGYMVTILALRIGSYRLAGMPWRHGPWSEVLAYEASKFLLFYLLFGGIHFGLQSYGAWANERLRTEQQANLARQAQLLQLTQQLQPHFLFNALNTISSLIHSDPDTADLLLTRLATLLRAATDASRRPEQPFADELALLRAYADIMTQRFADHVRIHWEIDAPAQACRVPTLGLQPLLENCFRHVVERRNGLTHISIRAREYAGKLQFEIEDDGDLESLPTARGIGLGNLEERLQSMYGTRAGLSLRLRPGGGLIVRVELPCAH
ncbi:sensor histidine kinase [Burkholderia gladioli]|uniref:sensor histidine kinase n=1 Tax=Burkholderia gladioli TaxID=28095 RepID=UPI0030D25AD9